ncbi:MAG: hypothetical protein HS103_06445 [Anaerolineales bacterium]|nr:hypothetical protein [Anaerolineales bacterium]
MATSITQYHAEWLSLIEVSDPFLSINTLQRVFPQGLNDVEATLAAQLRANYNQWLTRFKEPSIHRAWAIYILKTLLEWDDRVLAEGQAIPNTLKYIDETSGEIVRPSFMLHEPRHPDRPCALIMTYPQTQEMEKLVPKSQWAASPAARMLALLRYTGVTLGIVTNGDQWMLVSAPQNGGTASYISWYAELWNEERLTLQAFISLLNARRFFGVAEEDTLEQMLIQSADDAQEVTDQLGTQVRHAVEILVHALDRADQDNKGALLKEVSESKLYEAALTVMMRLVFLFSAEDAGCFCWAMMFMIRTTPCPRCVPNYTRLQIDMARKYLNGAQTHGVVCWQLSAWSTTDRRMKI